LIFSEVPDDPSGELAVDLAGDLADELAEVSADDFRDGFSGSPVNQPSSPRLLSLLSKT
jgi:hypothetical protein